MGQSRRFAIMSINIRRPWRAAASAPCRSNAAPAAIRESASQMAQTPWKGLRNGFAARGLGVLSECLGPCSNSAFGILTYHRIAFPPAGSTEPTWNVAPGRFRAQIRGLLTRGYRPWPLRTMLACHRAMRQPPPKSFVVTFDDGYGNVYDNAFPILREYKVPATLFLATAYLDQDTPFPFDDWSLAGVQSVPAETWRPITSGKCEEMLASGLVELGAHTHVHADFRGRPEELRRDLIDSLDLLRTRFGVHEATFAFPFGYGCRRRDGPQLAAVAKESGLLCALTTENDMVCPGDDPYNWGRFDVTGSDSAASLAGKLSGWYGRARRAWRCLQRRNDGDRRVGYEDATCPRIP